MIGLSAVHVGIIQCLIHAGFLILLSMTFCNGMPTDLSTERFYDNLSPTVSSAELSENFDPLEIDDGQTVEQKLRVMQLLSQLEQTIEKKLLAQSLNDTDNETSIEVSPPSSPPYIFEGDIILQPAQALELVESGKRRQKRKLHANANLLWKLPIWYTYHPNEYTREEEEKIQKAIGSWESLTCIVFKKIEFKHLFNATYQIHNANNMTINFTKNIHNECWSYVGKRQFHDGVQRLSIDTSCLSHGSLIHELGHVIGFWHEHARPDRDAHITVDNGAIEKGKNYNFLDMTWKKIDDKNISYDVGSVMHYSATAFAKTSLTGSYERPTLIAKDIRLQRALGQRRELSFYDTKLANIAYCKAVCDPSKLEKPCQNDGYQDPKNCSRCRCADGLSGDYCEKVQTYTGANCGGENYVTEKKLTFSFTGKYGQGQKCSWLFKTDPHKNIKLDFVGDFMMYFGCTNDPNIKCRDFVEVRYFHNLAKTGARFCCYNEPKAPTIISEGNEMLVIMRAYGKGQRGFKAEVRAEYCGGFGVSQNRNNHNQNQHYRPCSRSKEKKCLRVWKTVKKVPCNVWFTWDRNCKMDELQNETRPAECFYTEEYCADGYSLENGMCVPSTYAHGGGYTPTIPEEMKYIESNNTSNGYQNDPVGWHSWSEWSSCSITCGGCGVQTRQRICDDPQNCGGNTFQNETRPCGNEPCDTDVTVNKCTRIKTVEYLCTPLSFQKCTRNETEEYDCYGWCCEGYSLQEKNCVPIKT